MVKIQAKIKKRGSSFCIPIQKAFIDAKLLQIDKIYNIEIDEEEKNFVDENKPKKEEEILEF